MNKPNHFLMLAIISIGETTKKIGLISSEEAPLLFSIPAPIPKIEEIEFKPIYERHASHHFPKPSKFIPSKESKPWKRR